MYVVQKAGRSAGGEVVMKEDIRERAAIRAKKRVEILDDLKGVAEAEGAELEHLQYAAIASAVALLAMIQASLDDRLLKELG